MLSPLLAYASLGLTGILSALAAGLAHHAGIGLAIGVITTTPETLYLIRLLARVRRGAPPHQSTPGLGPHRIAIPR